MADVRLEAEDRGLAEQLDRLKERLEAEDLEVELCYSFRKSADVVDAARWLLEIVVTQAVGEALYPKIREFLSDWFRETPEAEKRPLRVRVRQDDELEPIDEFELDG